MSIQCSTPLPKLAHEMARHFRELQAPPAEGLQTNLEVRFGDGAYRVLGDGAVLAESVCWEDAARALKGAVIRGLLGARSDLLWLHAGAAADGGRAALVVGTTGCGKSTLTTSLCARGWTYLTDDLAPLDLSGRRVLPFPLSPEYREDPGWDLQTDTLDTLPKVPFELLPGAIARAPVPVGQLVFPAYRRGLAAAERRRCSPGEAAAELLSAWVSPAQRGGSAARALCELARRVPAHRLTYGGGAQAAAIISSLAQRSAGTRLRGSWDGDALD